MTDAIASQNSPTRWCGWIGTVLIGLSLVSCTPSPPETGNEKPRVVSTSTAIADWTEIVGGDEIDHTGILEPGADPHIYEPVPQDSIAFEEADLILYNGYNLEPGLIKLMNAAGVKARKLAVGEVIEPLDMDYDGQQVPDPHVWGNVSNAIVMVEAIRDVLIELSPEDEALFRENTAAFVGTLAELHGWIEAQIATIPPENRRLVTTHDAFQYFTRAYGLQVTGTLIGMSTEEQPSAQTVTQLVEQIKAAKVPAIFAETTINPKLIQTVAEEAGVQLSPRELYSDSLGAPGSEGDSYVKMMVSNTRAIVEALGGEYTPFPMETGDRP
ncbi:metal ABC transporter substrate-binding protein [Oxynema sp. CENA135]|uniref:metal ABC transporter substrate-binding protein n=1 Tax=Oxynema sp. CENA135 TaxID=984206 RepID=UPI00190E18B3|nr:metal ABC transporter substrate-binding protein [Oxynema sp. CENA135]MBK4731403.1 metal ABC transporter substrate-binding protein [Oxynema sp. CENA135]